mmetsp:Transcript_57436/g.95108  ORF Transcript_57436/g.95108 Transcript_57436/m.95108 type:complete len:223 (-) Transcript_57436:664-1332(-)
MSLSPSLSFQASPFVDCRVGARASRTHAMGDAADAAAGQLPPRGDECATLGSGPLLLVRCPMEGYFGSRLNVRWCHVQFDRSGGCVPFLLCVFGDALIDGRGGRVLSSAANFQEWVSTGCSTAPCTCSATVDQRCAVCPVAPASPATPLHFVPYAHAVRSATYHRTFCMSVCPLDHTSLTAGPDHFHRAIAVQAFTVYCAKCRAQSSDKGSTWVLLVKQIHI